MHPWDEEWPRLRRSEVYPFPLATETNHTADGWEVNLVVLSAISGLGHSSITVASYTKPYGRNVGGADDRSVDAANAVTDEALDFFARRLRKAMAGDEAADRPLLG